MLLASWALSLAQLMSHVHLLLTVCDSTSNFCFCCWIASILFVDVYLCFFAVSSIHFSFCNNYDCFSPHNHLSKDQVEPGISIKDSMRVYVYDVEENALPGYASVEAQGMVQVDIMIQLCFFTLHII